MLCSLWHCVLLFYARFLILQCRLCGKKPALSWPAFFPEDTTPKGCEGLGYSLMLSIRNVALFGADIVGSHLADHVQDAMVIQVEQMALDLLGFDEVAVVKAAIAPQARLFGQFASQPGSPARCDPGLSAGKRRKPDRRQTNDRDGFSGSRTIAHLHRFNRRAAGGCDPFRRPGVRNRTHASGSRKAAPK